MLSDASFEFYNTSSSTTLKITNGGNVGIGTTSPGAYLEVYGSTTSNDVVGMFTGTGQYGSAIHLKATGTNGSNWRILSTASGSTPGGGYFGLYNDSAGLYRFVISPTGNVGIGTASPAQKLDVVGKMKISDDIILAQTNGRIDYDNGVSTGALRFWSTNGTAERMRITSGGNVGIGTTSPAYKLEVSGGAISIKGNAAGNSLRFDDSGGTSRNAMYVDTSNYLNVGNANYAGVKFVQTASAPNTNSLEGNAIQQAYGTSENGIVLAEPDAWLAVRIGTTDYAIPMYIPG
jgi:hypothetical protein